MVIYMTIRRKYDEIMTPNCDILIVSFIFVDFLVKLSENVCYIYSILVC